MSKGKYYSIGHDTGYEIAQCNISELKTSGQDKFVSDMCEHESDVYRQFTPFEFLAREINEYESYWSCEGKLWDCYDRGVYDGILQCVKDNQA